MNAYVTDAGIYRNGRTTLGLELIGQENQ